MSFATYPKPTLPLTGSELLMLAQSQNGQLATCTATVASLFSAGTSSALFASPPPIGSVTPNTGAFTTVTGNVSSATVLATGGTTARTLGGIGADALNVKNYGLMLNGTANDSTPLQALYNAAPSNSTINIPTGNWDAALTPAVGKNIHWNLLGTLDYGTSAAGTNPVTNIGDGDVISGFFAGRYEYSKTISASTNSYAVLCTNLTNQSGSQFPAGDVIGNLRVSTTSSAGCSGYTWGITSVLSAGATGGANNQDVAINATVTRPYGAAGATWQFSGNTIDETGLPPNSSSAIVAIESDINSNGPEVSSIVYNSSTGGRAFINLDANAYHPASWAATVARTLGTLVQGSVAGVPSVFICTTAGTTGSTQPTWPASGTVTDGTVVWTYGTTVANQVSRGFSVATDANTELGAGFYAAGNYIGAVADFSHATLVNANVAGLRLSPNMPIDFSGGGTLATLNLRTLSYNPTASALQYVAPSGTLSINDAGVLSAPGISGTPVSGSTGSFTTLAASGAVSGVGFSNYMGSPPAIGGTAANSGAFTVLTLSGNASGSPAANITGTYAVGFDTANATLSGSALRMASGQTIAFEATNTLTLGLGSGNVLNFSNGASARLSLSLNNGNITMESGASLQIGSAYTATVVTPTGYITITDSSGTVRKIPCL